MPIVEQLFGRDGHHFGHGYRSHFEVKSDLASGESQDDGDARIDAYPDLIVQELFQLPRSAGRRDAALHSLPRHLLD